MTLFDTLLGKKLGKTQQNMTKTIEEDNKEFGG